MRALLDFLYVHGIKNFELPPTLEPGIKEKFEKAQAAREEEADKKLKKTMKKFPMNSKKKNRQTTMSSLPNRNCLKFRMIPAMSSGLTMPMN